MFHRECQCDQADIYYTGTPCLHPHKLHPVGRLKKIFLDFFRCNPLMLFQMIIKVEIQTFRSFCHYLTPPTSF